MNIHSIINAARILFPIEEYGYRSWLQHPGAKIVQSEANNPTGRLMLRASQPRLFENGRYFPGWDCLEATRYLMVEFGKAGYPATPIRLSSDVHTQDFAVKSEDGIVTITPGVESAIATGQFTTQGEADDLENLWQKRETIDHPVSHEMMLLNWKVAGNSKFSNYAGIYFQPGDIFELVFQTNLIAHGKKVEGMEFSLFSSLKAMERIREIMLEENYETALRSFRSRAIRAPFTFLKPPGHELELVKKVNSEAIQEIAPDIVKLLDQDWVKTFNTPKKGFFGRLFDRSR